MGHILYSLHYKGNKHSSRIPLCLAISGMLILSSAIFSNQGTRRPKWISKRRLDRYWDISWFHTYPSPSHDRSRRSLAFPQIKLYLNLLRRHVEPRSADSEEFNETDGSLDILTGGEDECIIRVVDAIWQKSTQNRVVGDVSAPISVGHRNSFFWQYRYSAIRCTYPGDNRLGFDLDKWAYDNIPRPSL